MVNNVFFLTQMNLEFLEYGKPLYKGQQEAIIHLSSDCILLKQTTKFISSIEFQVTLKALHEGFIYNNRKIRCCVHCFAEKHRSYLLETPEQEKTRKEKELHRMAFIELGLPVPPEYL